MHLALSLGNPAVGANIGSVVKAADISLSSTKGQQKLVFEGVNAYMKKTYGENSEIYQQFNAGAAARKAFSTRFGSAVDFLTSVSNYFDAGRELAQAEWEALASILDIGGLEYQNGETKQTITRSLDRLNYGEALRAKEFMEHGYQSFFNSLDKEVADAIREEFKALNKEYGNVINFILNGGQENLAKCKVEKIEKALQVALGNAGKRVPSGTVEKADDWFREYNINEVAKYFEEN